MLVNTSLSRGNSVIVLSFLCTKCKEATFSQPFSDLSERKNGLKNLYQVERYCWVRSMLSYVVTSTRNESCKIWFLLHTQKVLFGQYFFQSILPFGVVGQNKLKRFRFLLECPLNTHFGQSLLPVKKSSISPLLLFNYSQSLAATSKVYHKFMIRPVTSFEASLEV